MRHVALLLLTLLSSASATESRAPPADGPECSSKRGGDREFHCAVSIFRLIANPEVYSGKRIFTIAYLVHESPGSEYLGVAPTADSIRNSDLLSCVRIVAASARRDGSDSPYPGRRGIYAVEVSGVFSLTKNKVCPAELHNARIYELRLVEEYADVG